MTQEIRYPDIRFAGLLLLFPYTKPDRFVLDSNVNYEFIKIEIAQQFE